MNKRIMHYTTGTGHGAFCVIMYWKLNGGLLGAGMVAYHITAQQAAQRLWVTQEKGDVTCQDCEEWIHA